MMKISFETMKNLLWDLRSCETELCLGPQSSEFLSREVSFLQIDSLAKCPFFTILKSTTDCYYLLLPFGS